MDISSTHLLFVLGLRGLLAFFAFLLESHFPEKQGVKKFVSVILTRARIWLTLQICRGQPRTDMNSKWAVFERNDTSVQFLAG